MRIRFTDNDIHDGGLMLSGHTALVVSKTRASVFAFNHVHDFNYNGINLGGGLGRNFQFSMLDCLVLNNHIHHLGRGHYNGNDLAGIYLHGIGLGVEVRGNVIHDITCTSYGGNGIYLDAAASNFLIENNVIYNCNTDAVNVKGFHNRLVNNILYNTHDAGLRNTDAFYEEVGAAIERNIIVPRSAAIYRCRWGRDLERMNLETRGNTVWSLTEGGDLVVEQVGIYGLAHGDRMAFDEWRRKTGQGQGALVADPLFADPDPATSGDFTLRRDSPALKAGFKPFDFRNAGPRPKAKRTPVPFRETTAVGSPEHREYVSIVMPSWLKAKEEKKGKGAKRSLLDHVE